MGSKFRYTLVLPLIISSVGYLSMAYFLPRTDFFSSFGVYSLLFACYIYILNKQQDIKDFSVLLYSAILFRLIFLFSVPALSDDFNRFFWDGNLMHEGINPYTYLPSDLIETFSSNSEMSTYYSAMNSQNYYSVYPPFSQLSFYLATFFTKESLFSPLVVYRILILLCEIAMLPSIFWLLNKLNKSRSLVFIYLLNPLIILEFTGNLHGEVFVIFALLLSIRFLFQEKYIWSAMLFGTAISIKLLPLIFLPILVRYTGMKKGIWFSLISFSVLIVSFLPFIDDTFIDHIRNSVGLYYNSFEFNSSIGNAVRYGFKFFTGSYHHSYVTEVLGWLTLSVILIISFKYLPRNPMTLFKRMSIILLIYLLFAMSIHPWYITPLIAFAIFIPIHYGIVWSFLIFLTYITYSTVPYQQNLYMITLEYALLLGLFLYYKRRRIEFI